jgi:LacI family transcriptional regulator
MTSSTPSPHITLAQIAEKAGCSRSTVSRALRNHPAIPETTSKRIQKLAEKMGWQPDPEATRLMQYLQSTKKKRIDSALALINDFPERKDLLKDPYTCRLLASARQRAQTFGFRLDEIWLREKGMTARRASSILRNRGIRGVLIPPEYEPLPRIELDWEILSAVATTTTALPVRLHRVLPDNYNNFRLLMSHVIQRGWKRPMLLSLQDLELRMENCPSNVYIAICQQSPELELLPVFYWDEKHKKSSADTLKSQLKRLKPDGLIVADTWLAELAGNTLPWVSYSNGGDGHAGIDQRPEAVGAAAIDMLSAHVIRSEQGLPDSPKLMHIAGCWRE